MLQQEADEPKRNLRFAATVLVVYAVHNAWNCWVFLNFTNFGPAQQLLGVGEREVGLLTTVGFLGILAALLVATLSSWPRAVLVIGGVLNATAPMLRYIAVSSGWSHSTRYACVLASSFLQGNAFGLIGAAPAMLAALQWPERLRSFVIAVASLSNYVGGAAGTAAMPVIAGDAASLLRCFRWQAYASVPLGLGVISWCYLPPIESASRVSLREELRMCCRRRAALCILGFGLAIGLSLALQGVLQFILTGCGLSPLEAGVANTFYQASAALVGLLLSGRIRSPRALPRLVRTLHVAALASYVALSVLCAALRRGSVEAAVALVCASAALGATLLGLVPFLLQLAVHEVGASEMTVSGAVYIVCFAVAAAVTQLAAILSSHASLALIGGLLVFECVVSLGTLSRWAWPWAAVGGPAAGSTALLTPRHSE